MGRSDQQRLLAVMFAERREAIRIISARRTTRYDFSQSRPNKYASRYKKGALVVTLDAEVAQVFQSAENINETLRSLARIIQADRNRQSNKAPGA